MGSGLSTNDPTIVAAFHKALFQQGFAIFLILTLVAVAWSVLRSVQLRRAAMTAAATGEASEPGDSGRLATGHDAGVTTGDPEPVARRFLRISFGLLWIFDGILQGQASMPLGLIPQGIQPAASASPHWVQHLVSSGTNVWTYHPVSAAAASVWIQIGIGLWLLAAPRGNWSRLGGLASVGLGGVGLDIRRVLRGDFCPWGQLALRGSRRGGLLLHRRRSHRPAGQLMEAASPRSRDRWPPSGCSSSAWPSCRPGRGEGSGRARRRPPGPPGA